MQRTAQHSTHIVMGGKDGAGVCACSAAVGRGGLERLLHAIALRVVSTQVDEGLEVLQGNGASEL